MTGQLGLLGGVMPRLIAPTDLDPAEPWHSCGPAALAAALGWSLAQVRPRLTHERGYMAPDDMQIALDRCAHSVVERPRAWPDFGLAMIMFDGPWMEPDLPSGAAMSRSHWIAVNRYVAQAGGEIYDVNCDRVVFFDFWCRGYAFDLARSLDKRATGGWSVRLGLEISRRA